MGCVSINGDDRDDGILDSSTDHPTLLIIVTLWINKKTYKMVPQFVNAKLVQTTPITWVYGRCTLTSCGLRTSFNGKSRILNWTYVSTIFFAIFCGDIPWLLLPMCFQSNKHDFNAGPKIVYLAFEHPVIMSTINISDIGVKKSPT